MADPPSPCTKVCIVEPVSGLCRGCGRSLGEIEHWIAFTAEERAQVMAQLPARMAALHPRPAPPR